MGLSVVLLFAFHGATFLTIRTSGDLCERAARAARRLALLAAIGGTAFLAWTVAVAVDRNDKDVFPPILPAALGIAALLLAVLLAARRSAWAFVATGLGAVLWVVTVFVSLYPRVMVSSTGFGNSLTVDGASSAHYTLAVMSVVALICVPVVLLYQGWTDHVFRARVAGDEVSPAGEERQAPDAGMQPAGRSPV